jgi:hypothetical protein
MRLDLISTFDLASESDTGEAEPAIVVLVDRRGRRTLVPVNGRAQRYRTRATAFVPPPGLRIDAAFSSGTIH